MFFRDTIKYLPVKILPAFAGLLAIYVLTKNFSQENYINYTFIISSIILVAQLFNGWLNSSVIYFFSHVKQTHEEANLIKNFLFLHLIFQFFGSASVFFVVFLGLQNIYISLISMIIFLLQGGINFCTSILQSKRLIGVQVFSTSVQASIQIITLLAMSFLFRNNIEIYLTLFMFSYMFSLVLLLFHRKYFKINLEDRKIDKGFIFKVLSYGMPICIWIFSMQFYSIGDRTLLKYLGITNSVVNYVAFKDLSIGLSGFVSMPLLMASHPIIMNLVIQKNDKKAAANVIENNINILLMLFLPCIIIIYFYGEYLLSLLLNEKYLLSPVLMVLVLLTVLMASTSVYFQKGLETSFQTKKMSIIALLVAVFSGLSNIMLLPFFGVKSVIIVGLISQLLYILLIIYYSNSLLPLNYKSMNILFFVLTLILSIIIGEFDFISWTKYLIPIFIVVVIVFSVKKMKLMNRID
ncbi:lipopolysaccharide biosynthesis protein [Riemerella anatipestifer]|uniref:lipopolysaccharide biosynthesis protein n=1 Tax=Riemerella anatipestifer TaxID=34085 RepID=UPI0007EDC7AA|nr:oligosaccharide flippase family protein [Riemerella anatipestifer]MCE4248741.1 oligosaccharide flippase family protein [Riemerella anatipestifer]MCO7315778.1 oligosaccharide flippase family protein [Riemerella anatipestifer]MCO7324053.1 oligosaccharide flippase family protein [Riemerella anatipestifer]MCQ4062683.1 oligosaccharide flippase family protein [Riemerella anatipestifer]MCQ4156850.1 oligosaccharide flippase family protein [Riemerella anatipestifer]